MGDAGLSWQVYLTIFMYVADALARLQRREPEVEQIRDMMAEDWLRLPDQTVELSFL